MSADELHGRVGDRIGLIVYLPQYIPYFRSQVRAYRMEQFMGGYRSVDILLVDDNAANRELGLTVHR